jgi:DNA polymerase-4
MDAFYASVELLRYPELRGLPVVIGGRSTPPPRTGRDGRRVFSHLRDYAGRGVVTTSTYEARALGVFSAMGIMKAAALAPDAVLLPADFTQYRHYSRLFKAAVARVAPCIEDRGIDEIYVDLTAHAQPSQAIGRRIKDEVRSATGGLVCSVGISPNKLLSKIGSDLDKPDGLTILAFDDLQRRIWPLPVKKINGIGPKANAKLADLGICTIADLARASPSMLQKHFGLSHARWMVDVAHGRDDRPVVTHSQPKSISRETTFERDLHAVRDRTVLSDLLMHLCEHLAADLVRKGCASRTIGVKLRFDDFRIVTRDVTLDAPTVDAACIVHAARMCLKRVTFDRRMRLLGIRASGLVPIDGHEHDAVEHAVQLNLY